MLSCWILVMSSSHFFFCYMLDWQDLSMRHHHNIGLLDHHLPKNLRFKLSTDAAHIERIPDPGYRLAESIYHRRIHHCIPKKHS